MSSGSRSLPPESSGHGSLRRPASNLGSGPARREARPPPQRAHLFAEPPPDAPRVRVDASRRDAAEIEPRGPRGAAAVREPPRLRAEQQRRWVMKRQRSTAAASPSPTTAATSRAASTSRASPLAMMKARHLSARETRPAPSAMLMLQTALRDPRRIQGAKGALGAHWHKRNAWRSRFRRDPLSDSIESRLKEERRFRAACGHRRSSRWARWSRGWPDARGCPRS
jgi:hypothetical protein